MNDETTTDAERQVLRRQLLVNSGFTPEHAQLIDETAQRAVAAALATWQSVVMDPTLPFGTGAPIAELGIAWLIHEAKKTEELMAAIKADAVEKVGGMSLEEAAEELRANGVDITIIKVDTGEEQMPCPCPRCTARRAAESATQTRH